MPATSGSSPTRTVLALPRPGGSLEVEIGITGPDLPPLPSPDDPASFVSTASWPLPAGCPGEGEPRLWTRWDPSLPPHWIHSLWIPLREGFLEFQMRVPESGYREALNLAKCVLDSLSCETPP